MIFLKKNFTNTTANSTQNSSDLQTLVFFFVHCRCFSFSRGVSFRVFQLCLELLHKSPHRWIHHRLPAVGFSHLPQHHGHIFHIALNLKLMLYETCDGKNVSKQIWYFKRKGCQRVWGKNVWGLTPQLHILHKLSRSRLQNFGIVFFSCQVIPTSGFQPVSMDFFRPSRQQTSTITASAF